MDIIIPDNLTSYLEVVDCNNFPVDKYFVTEDLREIISRIERHQKHLKVLANDYNEFKLNATLLYGPTGTGKTTMGKYIAYAHGLPFIYVNFAKLLDGVFGSTARTLSAIFNFIKEQECVFMLDEIDYIAQKRGTESEATGGALGRTTTTLMQEFDIWERNKVDTILLAGTNRIDIMDPAFVSRFYIKKKIDYLKNQEKIDYILLWLNNKKIPYDINNIKEYCHVNPMITNRDIENDMVGCLIDYISTKKKKYTLKRLSTEGTLF